MPRKRILFFAEGATMAHFTRPLALAQSLDPDRYDIVFCSPGRFIRFLENRAFVVRELQTMPGEQFLKHLSQGAPLFPRDVIRRYVHEDRHLISEFRPNMVVGDLRPSLAISASLENVPSAVITNAYWSPYAKRRAIVPSIPITRLVSPRILNTIYRFTEPLAHAFQVGGLNAVRQEFGLPRLSLDARAMFTDGTHVLYADVPEFVPTRHPPSNHHYVGTCQWAPPIPKPDWWEQMRADPRPKVLVAMGSSGALRILPALLSALSKLPVAVVIATSGRPIPSVVSNAYMAELLPLEETAREARVVVCHGGSPGSYPAISSGTPVLGIPSNADQQLATVVLAENGAGLGVRVEDASERRPAQAIEKLLFKPEFRRSAQAWSSVFQRYDSGSLFRRFVDEKVA